MAIASADVGDKISPIYFPMRRKIRIFAAKSAVNNNINRRKSNPKKQLCTFGNIKISRILCGTRRA